MAIIGKRTNHSRRSKWLSSTSFPSTTFLEKIIHITSRGANAAPALPPNWKTACAKERLPPEAKKEIREASGWNIEEPIPTKTTEHNTRV